MGHWSARRAPMRLFNRRRAPHVWAKAAGRVRPTALPAVCYNGHEMVSRWLRIILGAMAGCGLALAQTTAPVAISSPDGGIRMSFSAAGGRLVYDVSYRGKPVLTPSALGIEIQDQPVLGTDVAIASSQAGKIDETYTLPAGKSKEVRNRCNTLALDVRETKAPGRRFTLEARVYNDGAAFRYVVPEQEAIKELRIANEHTQFVFAKDATTFPLILRNYRTSWEDNYRTVALSGIHPESLIALPLLTELPGVAFLAITEANIENYSGMYLKHDEHNARSTVGAARSAYRRCRYLGRRQDAARLRPGAC